MDSFLLNQSQQQPSFSQQNQQALALFALLNNSQQQPPVKQESPLEALLSGLNSNLQKQDDTEQDSLTKKLKLNNETSSSIHSPQSTNPLAQLLQSYQQQQQAQNLQNLLALIGSNKTSNLSQGQQNQSLLANLMNPGRNTLQNGGQNSLLNNSYLTSLTNKLTSDTASLILSQNGSSNDIYQNLNPLSQLAQLANIQKNNLVHSKPPQPQRLKMVKTDGAIDPNFEDVVNKLQERICQMLGASDISSSKVWRVLVNNGYDSELSLKRIKRNKYYYRFYFGIAKKSKKEGSTEGANEEGGASGPMEPVEEKKINLSSSEGDVPEKEQTEEQIKTLEKQPEEQESNNIQQSENC